MPTGVLFAVCAYALYSCCDAIVKGLGSGLSVFQIAFFTTLFSLVPALLMTPKGENWLHFWKAKNPLLLHMRGVSGVIGNLCIIYAFVTIPLAEGYSIAFLAPIFVVVISVWLLAEKVSLPRWLLLLVSFVGVLIVVRPGFRELHWGHLTALVSAVCGAVTNATLRRIGREETRASLIGIASLYILVVNGALMLITGDVHQLQWQHWIGLLTIGALGGSANLIFIAATRRSPASMVAPMQYSQIFWAITFGALFYSEYPAPIAYLGLVFIVGAGMLNVMSDETRIRFFSRLSPGGAGPALMRETTRPVSPGAADAVLEAPIAGAPEAATEQQN